MWDLSKERGKILTLRTSRRLLQLLWILCALDTYFVATNKYFGHTLYLFFGHKLIYFFFWNNLVFCGNKLIFFISNKFIFYGNKYIYFVETNSFFVHMLDLYCGHNLFPLTPSLMSGAPYFRYPSGAFTPDRPQRPQCFFSDSACAPRV